ncbi:MAG: hypothetical protein ACLGSD_13890 [Acidobacteriota bacterium]
MLKWLNAAQRGETVPGLSGEALQRLQEYMDSWRQCAPNAMLWRDRFPAFWKAIDRSLAKTQLRLYAAPDGCIAAWDMRPGAMQTDMWRVDKLFADFLAGFHSKIALCQRRECGAYFEVSPKRNTYCSDRCGKMATSRVAKSAARHNERHRRMLRVLDFLRKLRESDPTADLLSDASYWKDQAIRSRSLKGMLTDRWLNEAILQRLPTPDGFAGCARCEEIRLEIHKVLKDKKEAVRQ